MANKPAITLGSAKSVLIEQAKAQKLTQPAKG